MKKEHYHFFLHKLKYMYTVLVIDLRIIFAAQKKTNNARLNVMRMCETPRDIQSQINAYYWHPF